MKLGKLYMESESSEKIHYALSHNIHTICKQKYFTGDSLNFKRANNRKWRGPGKVLGQDGQQILAKYGNDYLRVHPLYH